MKRKIRYLALVAVGFVAGAAASGGGASAQVPQPDDEVPAQLERRFDHRADGGEVPLPGSRAPGLGGSGDAGVGEPLPEPERTPVPEPLPLPESREDLNETL